MPDDRTPEQLAEDRLPDRADKVDNRLWAKIIGVSTILLVATPLVSGIIWAITDRATIVDHIDTTMERQKTVITKLREHDEILTKNREDLIEIRSDVRWITKTMGKADEPPKK